MGRGGLAIGSVARAILGEQVEEGASAQVRAVAGRSVESLVSEADEVVETEPAGEILCTSFAGCKGLSAHHVFVVGVDAVQRLTHRIVAFLRKVRETVSLMPDVSAGLL